jgi:ParB-like chromosome segregation protein Spo0J
MHYDKKNISIQDISLEDRTFIITTERNNAMLQKSIEQVGVLYPPYLYFDNHVQYYIIVCGLRRIHACVSAGWQDITANIIDEQTNGQDLFLLSLYDNLSHRLFDPIEKARAALRLRGFYNADTVISEYLPLMGLPPTEKALDQLLSLARLEPEIQDAVVQGRVCETVAARLAHLEEDERKALFGLLSQVHLSASKQEEIVSHCLDISLREGCGCGELVQDREIQEIIAEDKLPLSQKGDRIRALLRKKRFPRLSRHEENFLQQRKKMHLPAGVQLLPPPFFEGGKFRLEIEFSHTGDLQKKAEAILSLANNRLLQDMVENA